MPVWYETVFRVFSSMNGMSTREGSLCSSIDGTFNVEYSGVDPEYEISSTNSPEFGSHCVAQIPLPKTIMFIIAACLAYIVSFISQKWSIKPLATRAFFLESLSLEPGMHSGIIRGDTSFAWYFLSLSITWGLLDWVAPELIGRWVLGS